MPHASFPSPPAADRQRQREEILAAFADLVAARGYSRTTMKQVADRAGCSVGYLYRHFSGKLALARSLVDREVGRFEQIDARVRDLGLPPLTTYRRLLEELSRYLADRRALVRVFTRETVLQRLPEHQDRYARFRQRDRDLFCEAVTRGELPPTDCDLLGAVVNGVVDALMTHLAGRDDPDALLALPDRVFELVLDPLRERAQGR
jgi:AcrR family transcriptional regulator